MFFIKLNDCIKCVKIKIVIFFKLKKKISRNKQKGDIRYKNLWDTLKTVLRGKFIVLNAHMKRSKFTK